MRLDQVIAQGTGVSRKEAKKLIRQGRITLANKVASNPAERTQGQAVYLDGDPVTLPSHRYYMLHKPAGYVSATEDKEHPTALSLLPSELRQDVHIAGRLDKDTTGLLLLTTDGQWSRRVTAPRYAVPKTYVVHLAEAITPAAIQRLETGLLLRGDTQPTAPARVEFVETHCIRLTITEGRYHQVKRMLAAVGNGVKALHREKVGNVSLPPELLAGEFCELSPAQVSTF